MQLISDLIIARLGPCTDGIPHQLVGVNASLVAQPRTPAHQLWPELLGRQNGLFETLALATQEATEVAGT